MSSSSARSLKNKPLSYGDIVCIFTELEGDLKEASQNLAQSTVQLLHGFNTISTQLHSVDMQAFMPPVKPQWKLIRKDYTELALQIRTNASTISARMKMFTNRILPLCTRASSSQSSHREKVHVLNSYMAISAEQAALTFQLVEKAVKLNAVSSNFHTEIARATSQRAQSGQRELQDLAQKISLLQTNVQNIFSGSSKLSCPDVTYAAFMAFRVVAATGRQSSKTKLARYQLTLNGISADLSQMSNLFQELDGTRNEVAHAQYTTQISHRKSDALSHVRIAISDLIPNEISLFETVLSLFMAIWLRLQADCLDICNWIANNREPPPCIAVYLRGGYTIYSTLSASLDAYAEAMDLQQFS